MYIFYFNVTLESRITKITAPTHFYILYLKYYLCLYVPIFENKCIYSHRKNMHMEKMGQIWNISDFSFLYLYAHKHKQVCEIEILS